MRRLSHGALGNTEDNSCLEVRSCRIGGMVMRRKSDDVDVIRF